MPERGLEPPPSYLDKNLNLARLPIPPLGRVDLRWYQPGLRTKAPGHEAGHCGRPPQPAPHRRRGSPPVYPSLALRASRAHDAPPPARKPQARARGIRPPPQPAPHRRRGSPPVYPSLTLRASRAHDAPPPARKPQAQARGIRPPPQPAPHHRRGSPPVYPSLTPTGSPAGDTARQTPRSLSACRCRGRRGRSRPPRSESRPR